MRRRLARILRSAAYRLDPPRPVTTDPGEDVEPILWGPWTLGCEYVVPDPVARRVPDPAARRERSRAISEAVVARWLAGAEVVLDGRDVGRSDGFPSAGG